jgi:hypothetical protein
MLGICRSEVLKLKNSFSAYLIFAFLIIQIITVLPYIWFIHRGINFQNVVFLNFLILPLLSCLLAILSFDQEKQANQFQEIRSYKYQTIIWLGKLFILDILLIIPAGIFWLTSGQEQDVIVTVAGSLMSVLLLNIHMLLTIFVNKLVNLLISFVECIFIIFASNGIFNNIFWIPQTQPISLILQPDVTRLVVTILWVILIDILFAICIKLNKFQSK